MATEIKKHYRWIQFWGMMIYLSIFSGACLNSNSSSKNSDDDNENCSENGVCKLFITDALSMGNLGGTAGADAKCMSDANYPGSGTYKAMIGDSSRSASPTPTDWVLKASTEYRRLDDTVIGTTNASRVFSFPLDNAMSTEYEYVWTGLDDDWTTPVNGTCNNWTDSSTSYTGFYGYAKTTSSSVLDHANYYCDYNNKIVCVEQ